MDIKAIRSLIERYTVNELESCVTQLEEKGGCDCSEKTDPELIMSDLLQAMEVRSLVDSGLGIQDAIREFSKRVRGVLTRT